MDMNLVQEEIYHFYSEPGDATRYDFYLISMGTYILCFSDETDMAYPSRLNMGDILEPAEDRNFSDRLLLIAELHKVNPNTYNQVMIACKKLLKK